MCGGGGGDVNAYAMLKQQNTTLMGIKGGRPSKNPRTYSLKKNHDMNS